MTRLSLFAAAVFYVLADLPSAHAQIAVLTTRIGDPIWKPAEVHLISGPADSFSSFSAFVNSIRPSADVPTPPPYDTIVGDGMAAAGVTDSALYETSSIDGQPNGSIFTYTLVPDPGTTGSSFNFDSGPIIPANLFPFQTDIALYREGVVVDGDFPAAERGPPGQLEGFDGLAYVHPFFATHQGFLPPGTDLVGSYEWRAVLRDLEGNGWDIAVPFQVVPEPTTAALVIIGFSVCLALHRRRTHRKCGE